MIDYDHCNFSIHTLKLIHTNPHFLPLVLHLPTYLTYLTYLTSAAYTPNCTDEETKEVYTGYTTCVNFQKLAENRMISWQMMLKFSSFQRLEGMIKRFSSLSSKVLLPVMKKGIFSGETDAMRIERMTRLNNWIHDLVSEILLMTVADFVDIIFEFLEIENQVGLDDIYQLREE